MFIKVCVSASPGSPTSATSYGWKIEKSKTAPWYEESLRSSRGAGHGECSGAPIRKYRIACHQPAKRVMSRLRSYFETDGNPVRAVIVMGFAESLPFVGITSLGWVLLKGYDAEPLAVSAGSVESAGAARGMARSVSRTTSRVWGARSGTSGVKAAKEKELLKAIRREGRVTVVVAAIETSLSVEAPGPWPPKSAIGEGRCTTRLTTLDPQKTSTLFLLGMLHKSSEGGCG